MKPVGLARYVASSRGAPFANCLKAFPKVYFTGASGTISIRGSEFGESPDESGYTQPRWLRSAQILSRPSASEWFRRDVLNQKGRWNYEVDGWSIGRGWVVHISSCRPDLMIADGQYYLIAASVVCESTAQICTACSRNIQPSSCNPKPKTCW